MTLAAVVDNDILIKGACYSMLDKMADAIPIKCRNVGVLGAAKYVVKSRIYKAHLNRLAIEVIRDVDRALRRLLILEPTEQEILLAAELEEAAQRLGLPLDSGESQLCAIAVLREVEWFITGDKRAVGSFEELLKQGAAIGHLTAKILCLEQILFILIGFRDRCNRDAVCAEPRVDKALTLALSCSSSSDIRSELSGLRSYIEDLRLTAPKILSPV